MLDIGCGWGPIALSLAMLAPQAEVYAVDVNSRSLSLTEQNARALGLQNVSVSTPDEVDPTLRFDTIWSNPPIRVGKEVLQPQSSGILFGKRKRTGIHIYRINLSLRGEHR